MAGYGVWRKAPQEPGQRDGASGPAAQGDGPDPGAAGRAIGRGADHGGALGTRPDPAAAVAAAYAGWGAGISADRHEELLAVGGAAARPLGRAAAVPRQLPAAVADFTGRAAELRTLSRTLDQAGAGAPGTVVISAIGGTAGVGKTALALRWAHQVAPFADSLDGHLPDHDL
jgi:hypothetical protein